MLGMCLGLFYTENGVMGLSDTEWIKVALNVLIGLFYW